MRAWPVKHPYHDRPDRDWFPRGRLPWGVSALVIVTLSLLLWVGIAALIHMVIG
jgi:hypothetical protein